MVNRKYKPNTKCSVLECKKIVTCKGYCNIHYQRFRRYGTPLICKRVYGVFKTCTIDGCNKPHKIKGYCRKHYRRYTFSVKDLERDSRRDKKRNMRIRMNLILLLGGAECNRCGFNDIRALQIDHKKGDGNKDRKRFKGNIELYQYYLKHPKESKINLQVLCSNCNWIKLHENNETKKRTWSPLKHE